MRDTEKRNITLSMPVGLLRAAKRLAVERGTSLSGLMQDALSTLVADQDAYRDAMEAEMQCLEEGLQLGTHGQIRWSRDELHER